MRKRLEFYNILVTHALLGLTKGVGKLLHTNNQPLMHKKLIL